MRKISFRWRITLMTALMIAMSCLVLNLLLYRSGAYYFDILADYATEYSDSGIYTNENTNESVSENIDEIINENINVNEDSGETIVIDMTPNEFEAFRSQLSDTVTETKSDFAENGWIITILITLAGSVIAHFVSGINLKPIKAFSAQAERIQAGNLTEVRLDDGKIPEFHALSQSINRMLSRLSDGFDAQRQFVGNAAHELRTPLALIQARLDLYKKDPQEEAEPAISFIDDQIGRLSELAKTLLSMSDLESVPRDEEIDLEPLIEEVLTDLSTLADENSITLKQEGENIRVRGSDILLYRMLYNLVENGIKYNNPNGFVCVSVASADKDVLIRISDTGKGIPEGYRKSVFQPFYRVDRSRKRELGGVGLGLSLVWEVVRLHGGTVEIEDNAPSGAVFTVRLPECG